MKIRYLILPILLIITSCTSESDYVIINGKVQRSTTGDGVANQSAWIMTRKTDGSGFFSNTKILDQKQVISDKDGNFSVALERKDGAFVTVSYSGDSNYFGSGIFVNYSIGEPIIIETDKLIKFKIFVKNINPFDENDRIYVDFYGGLSTVTRIGIENFGVANTYRPGEGGHGAYEETSWTGMNVNSIVYYSVRETAQDFKVHWILRRNQIKTEGFTEDIPYKVDEVNAYSFEY